MPSELRLHPASIIFGLAAQLKQFVVPAIIVLFTAGTAGLTWQSWALVLVIPYCVAIVVRYASFRYRYDENEIVIRTGFIFRNERHVPYARIQNIDAVQNVLHRLLGVVEVRIQTGGGTEPEARMSVLPLAALEEMRQRVFEGRHAAHATHAAPAAAPDEAPDPGRVIPAAAVRTLLHLPTSELARAGFIENRGMVLIAAAFGLIWEFGSADRWTDSLFGEETVGRGVLRDFARAVFDEGRLPLGRIAVMAGALIALLLLIRLLSVVWAIVRLYNFRLTLDGEDLRTEFGLFTRVIATIPMHRIQTLTILEGPLHRLFGRAAVRVDTAGGHGGGGSVAQREWIAPIIRSGELPRFLAELVPDFDPGAVVWRGVAPRAFRRALKPWLVTNVLLATPFLFWLGWSGLPVLGMLVAWAVLASWQYVRHLGWATTDSAILFRDGWLRRRTSIARFAKIQAVSLHESPFDRRAVMARVRVDTAGARDLSHRVDVPYLPRDTAFDLKVRLASEAGQTAFRW